MESPQNLPVPRGGGRGKGRRKTDKVSNPKGHSKTNLFPTTPTFTNLWRLLGRPTFPDTRREITDRDEDRPSTKDAITYSRSGEGDGRKKTR